MNLTATQSLGAVSRFSAPQRASASSAENQAPAQGESFEASSKEEEPSRLQSAIQGAKVGFLASAAVGAGLTLLTAGAMLPVALVAVPICTVLGAYVGAVNPKFES
jgi:hypothetical protein